MFTFAQYHFLPTAALWAVCTLGAHAQLTKPCKAELRANRGKTLLVKTIQLSSTEWSLWDGIRVKQNGDSVHVQQNGAGIARFQIKRGQMQGTQYQEYYPHGRLKRVDSLSSQSGPYWHEESYFQLARAFVVNTRTYYPNGIPQTLHYYRRFGGNDSLRKTWYPDGTLQQTVWAFPSGTDSATWEWYPQGTLSVVRYEGHTRGYYPTGILKDSYTDTVIKEQPLTCKKEYYPGGTLRSVEYTWRDIPYLTWLYYSEEGVLAKSIKHVPPTIAEAWIPEVVMPIDPYPAFILVDIDPEFPGGTENFKNYLNGKLPNIVCESPVPLQGTYTILFEVNGEGKVSLQSIQGLNADGITEIARKTINAMPRWKPGKIGGRPANVMYDLKVVVSPK